MGEIIQFNTIKEYNHSLGLETLHPLVSVVDFSKIKSIKHVRANFGFYAIVLKETVCGSLTYGHNVYDYDEGTLVFIGPGQVSGVDDGGETLNPKGYAIAFHPDLLHGTLLSKRMDDYTFFSYAVREALHTSERERETFMNCLHEIEKELEHAIDKHSKLIITSNLEVLLNHCMRFYDRQFITREPQNKDVIGRFEQVLKHYFDSDTPQRIGTPTVQYCAEKLNLSANYLGDLIKKATGKSPQEHIQLTLIDRIKEKLYIPEKTINEIAYELGFSYPYHLSRMFKRIVGCTPKEYRNLYL
ncbi:helix-turn-helix domain-containing protein [Bacteroides reticulotermitis]|uniref:Transcriptional regulator n=2 Tax=Bacteroides reticulotermitis TaxID=1133319 RepID=W4UYJ6_9BACE|nr:helix-turn-helix domain-containing protein [Bacteroides reticulotermitis]MBB4046289.1 AraC-like DNA-binding protein [Bacteroides reticulotermitis]GAE86335.1 transcriptional regulator [Bacteroides reticulotermitis JCM 10512]